MEKVYQFTDIIHTPRLEQIKKESFVSLNIASQLNSIYHLIKMKQENVYYDYITYMDEKTAYDNQQKRNKKTNNVILPRSIKRKS